jgi:hypothetical protein
MAHVNVDGLHLRLTLTSVEKCAVGRGDLRIHRSRLVWVTHSPDIWDQIPARPDLLGVGYPGMALVGTVWRDREKDFCVVHDRGPGLVVTLRQHEFARVLFSVARADAWPLFARLREITEEQAATG